MSEAPRGEVIVVTGGSGLVGQAIKAVVNSAERDAWVPRKDDTFIFLSSKDGDITDPASVNALFEKLKPTMVIHLAAYVGGLYRNMNHPADMCTLNLTMNTNIIDACYKYKVKKLISCLSTCIFPDKVEYPITEEMLHNGPPHSSNAAYSFAKRMGDVQSRAYNQQFGTNFCTVVPTNIYGPYDNWNLEDSHVIPVLVHKFYNAKKAGTDMTIFGTGKPLRQFIFSRDLAKLFLWTLYHFEEKNSLIFAPDEEDEVSIADVANAIKEAIDFKGELKFDTTKSDGQYKKTASNKKLRTLMGKDNVFQFTPLKEGIKETVQWFVDNYDIARK